MFISFLNIHIHSFYSLGQLSAEFIEGPFDLDAAS